MNVILEALILAFIGAVFGLFLSSLMMFISDKKFSLKRYHFWWQVALSYFLTFFILHLGMEFSGVNKWYCKHGNACRI